MKRSGRLAVFVLFTTLASSRVPQLSAQEPHLAAEPVECPPIHVLQGDLAALNVAYAAPLEGAPARLRVRLLDSLGNPQFESEVSLPPGQSRSFSFAGRDALVRGEIVPLEGPERLRLETAVQVFDVHPDLSKTYAIGVSCPQSGHPVRPRPEA